VRVEQKISITTTTKEFEVAYGALLENADPFNVMNSS